MKFNINVAYESDFEIEAESEEEAKDIALRRFFEEPALAELQNLEVEDGS